MSKLVRGALRPTLDMAFRLETATSGAIPASAWAQNTSMQTAA